MGLGTHISENLTSVCSILTPWHWTGLKEPLEIWRTQITIQVKQRPRLEDTWRRDLTGTWQAPDPEAKVICSFTVEQEVKHYNPCVGVPQRGGRGRVGQVEGGLQSFLAQCLNEGGGEGEQAKEWVDIMAEETEDGGEERERVGLGEGNRNWASRKRINRNVWEQRKKKGDNPTCIYFSSFWLHWVLREHQLRTHVWVWKDAYLPTIVLGFT